MSLVGNLEDLGLGDILQIVSLSRKSGVLALTWGDVEGKIIFRDGQVVAASSTNEKNSLESLLYSRGLIADDKIENIGQTLNSLPDAPSVKNALVNDFGIEADPIDESIRQSIEGSVYHFFSWPEGAFSFELQEINSELKALKPPDHAFVLEVGLSPQFLAMEGTRLQDEHKRSAAEAPVAARTPSSKSPEASKKLDAPPPAAIPAPEIVPPLEEKIGAPASEPDEDFSSVSDALAFYEAKERGEVQGEDKPGEVMNETETPIATVLPEPEPPLALEPEPPPALKPVPPPAPEPVVEPVLEPEPVAIYEESTPLVEVKKETGPALLIVDDESLVLESLAHHLSGKGAQVKTFTHVAPALGYVREQLDMGNRPSAVICDLLMPDSTGSSTLGGLEMLEETRKINPGIPVYMMSDYENLPGRKSALNLGARFFFMKPKTSQLEEDMHSPELINFISVLENALHSEPEKKAAAPAGPTGDKIETGMINLGEELRREFGEEVVPVKAEQGLIIPSRGLPMLKAMINELNDPGASGQITLMILRFASELMNRAVIFLVAKKQLAGLGQFGIDLDGADAEKHVRQVRIPLNAPSIFREAIQKRMPLKKSLKKTKWNEYLIQKLGGEMPKEVFVAPIIAGGKIPALIYGDNVPDNKEIGDTESLEIFLAQAGLAMEKALLERKLREMGSPPEGVIEGVIKDEI